jgi:valyl-tRNA synthetase
MLESLSTRLTPSPYFEQTVLSIIHASRSLRQSNRVSIAKELPFKIEYSDAGAAVDQGELQKYVGEIKGFIKASSLEVINSTVSIFEGNFLK